MKVTLFALNSSYTHTNLAVRYLAFSLEKNNCEISIAEFNSKDKHDNILSSLYSEKSDIYAFSVYIWNRSEMLLFAKELKLLLPNIHIIFGGPEVSFENEDFFKKHPYIDTVIRGEGESVLPIVCASPERYRSKCINGTADKEFFKSCSVLYDKYPSTGNILYYESSRGCPHRCSYCLSSITNGVYAKSAKKALSDIKEFEKLPNKPRIIKFIDRTFNFDIGRAKQIWKGLLSDEYTLNYHFEICADTLDGECFEILKKMPAGKIQIEAGIQSTNPKTLSAINRSTDNRKAINNLKKIKDMGNIHVHADLIAGLPFEDMDSFKRSFNETIGCCHKLQLGFLKMLRGSLIRENKGNGYIFSPKAPYTVLANDSMSFEELNLLKKMAEVIDRIYSSDRFNNFCNHLISVSPSPFDEFINIAKKLENDVERISQNDLRLFLFRLYNGENELIQKLALDTLIWENKNPPAQLRPYYKELGKEKEFNIYTFNFAQDKKFYIDRTKHILKIIT